MSTASDPAKAAPSSPTLPPATTPSPAAASPSAAASTTAAALTTVPPTAPGGRWPVERRTGIRIAIALGIVVALFGCRYVWFRLTHSITEDAFVESHLVNISAQTVSGHLIRYLVEENDRVEQGQLLAEIDPVPYRDQVEVARSKVEAAAAELKRQESALERLKLEVPLQVEIAERNSAAAVAGLAKSRLALKLTTDDVDKAVEEAKAALDAATADALLAEQEFVRFTNLFKKDAVSLRRSQEVTRARDAAVAQRKAAESKLANAESNRMKVDLATHDVEVAETTHKKTDSSIALAETGYAQIHEAELLTAVKRDTVEEAKRALEAAADQLKYTQIRAPFPGIVVRRFRNLGDFASAGVSILCLCNPDLLYVTANLEETRLSGVAPGNRVELDIDAFDEPFSGRVIWINKSTGAQFALLPRNVVSGEFTKVVQRVPVRIQIDKDDRWPQLCAGLSAHVSIAHGPGDAEWAEQAAREMRQLEARYNQLQPLPQLPPQP